MKIFIELKKHFGFLGIGPDGKSNFTIQHLSIISLFAYCFIAMSAFVLFEQKSLMDLGNSFYGAACAGLNVFTFSSNVLKRTRIFGLFIRLENIIKKRYSQQAKIYDEVNEKIEKCTKIVYVSIVQITILNIFIPKLLASYWLYYITDRGSDAFKQTFTMSMPFDWKTPVGYAFTVSTQFGTWIFILIHCSCILCFLGGVCWLLVAMIEDIGKEIKSLNETSENSGKLKMKLYDIIQFHSTAKQFVNDISEIYEIIITGYYLWSLSTICCSLFMIHVESSRGITNPVEVVFALFGIFWAFAQIFVFCDFGQKLSDHFCEVDNEIYYCNWYGFPNEIQRTLPIIMISAQQEVTLNGFANLPCTREAFKKVANGGFSYFMMIRKMYH